MSHTNTIWSSPPEQENVTFTDNSNVDEDVAVCGRAVSDHFEILDNTLNDENIEDVTDPVYLLCNSEGSKWKMGIITQMYSSHNDWCWSL